MTAHFVINSMLIEVTVWDYNIKLGPIVFISTFNGLPRPQLYGSEIYEYLWISILVSIITEIWTPVRSDVHSMQHIWSCQDWKKKAVRDRPFNLQGGGGGLWFSVLFRNFFSDNTRVRIFIFLSIRLFFFPPPKSEYFFSVTLGIRIFFLEKKHTPPPPSCRLNGPSLIEGETMHDKKKKDKKTYNSRQIQHKTLKIEQHEPY